MKKSILTPLLFLALVGAVVPAAIVLSTAVHGQAEAPGKGVYTSPLAGRWYEADPEKLRNEVQQYLDTADTKPLENVQALILPHAGYEYSGQTAAYGIKQIVGKTYSRVIVIGPTHRVAMENMASVPDASHIATPLGEVPLDHKFIQKLKAHPLFKTVPQAHHGEHSVQIELPLLQVALGDFAFVPIVVGHLDLETAEQMGEILASLIDARTLVVASSDFTHYGPNYRYEPFKEDVPAQIEKLDGDAFEHVKAKNLAGFFQYFNDTGATICGRYSISVLLAALPDSSEAHLLKYARSGDTTGDYTNSVSYFAAAFTGQWAEKAPVATTAPAGQLSEIERQRLLQLARKAIEYAMEKKNYPPPDEDFGLDITPPMKEVRAAFVTLNREGRLRGCIGDIFPTRPLYKSVITNAVNAAFQDRRFQPLAAKEMEDLEIEISALTPIRLVDSYEDIVVGKHGVVLTKGNKRAVFLPQVAPEQGWNRDEMLTRLAQKAGLTAEAWKEDTAFEVFEARVFGEKSHGEEPAT